MMTAKMVLVMAAAALALPNLAIAQTARARANAARPASINAIAPQISRYFDDYARTRNIPGLVYGIVKDGRLILVRGIGVRDTATRAPVTADTRFRIASMSKAFTALAILKLRDEGRVSLDDPAERYVPELKRWRYPTADSPRIRVRDLLTHTAGFVEDNPWGDRQQPLAEGDFSRMLAAGVPFAQAPGIRMEYSNLGYATLGRIVGNVGRMPYQQWIGRNLLTPLGMTSTGYDVLAGPQGSRALGYRWQDEAWVREPDMADGAFGAMGGIQTSANDYARWVGFLLSAWPARDDLDRGPVKRGTVREIQQGSNFNTGQTGPATPDGTTCRTSTAYGMGWQSIDDCDLGRVLTHGGGYPGYGSTVILLPDAGVGIFAFSNRTYAGPFAPAAQALRAMKAAGLATPRTLPVDPGLTAAYAATKSAWTAGGVERAPTAVNMLLDRDAERRRADIAAAKARVGACPAAEPIQPISAMEGTFRWACARGAIEGRVQRAPTPALSLQVIDFRVAR